MAQNKHQKLFEATCLHLSKTLHPL